MQVCLVSWVNSGNLHVGNRVSCIGNRGKLGNADDSGNRGKLHG